jgi:hypothetical protein
MTRKTRTIVAVTLLATALCADRTVASAAESSRVEAAAGPVARGFAQRLTVSLRRVVPAVKLHQSRQEGFAAVVWRGDFEGAQAAITRGTQGTPFQFRLPPPVV